MIRLNRIGNKLGLAGLVGVVLSLVMVINEQAAESSILESNRRAGAKQQIADSVVQAETEMRNMQLAVRAIRLAKVAGEIEKGGQEFQRARSVQDQNLDAASTLGSSEEKARFDGIKALTAEYSVAANELMGAQSRILELYGKRDAISTAWASKLAKLLASPALAGAANRRDIESQLRDADGALSALLAAAWRFAAINDQTQKEPIARKGTMLSEALARARGLAESKAVTDGIDAFAADVKSLLLLTDEAVTSEEAKANISSTRTQPTANRAAERMQLAMTAARRSVEDSKAESMNEARQASWVNLGLSVVVVLSLLGSVVFGFLGLARPMTRLNDAMAKVAAGDLGVVIPGAGRGDEIGEMAGIVEGFKNNAIEVGRLKVGLEANEKRVAAEQKATMSKLADDFESAVGVIVETVSSASTKLEASAGTLSATAERAQELTVIVAAASEKASGNVQSVASSAEEMASSVNEIGRQVQESARMANEAVGQARITNDRVSELSKAASRIGDVVELINTIAGQTNLLALNATIEAARAGDAGRGFAVVASEVKALAEQTAKATGEIGQQITGIQAATRESVNAIKEISSTIEKLSEISSTIAAAVEEQGAATQEISRNVQQAAHGTQQVSSNITDVQRGASETGTASSQVLSAAQSLSGDSNRLKLEVGKFLNSVRAA
ncbi:MAG: methyl-accepting chemotaxis sensory transducer [Bradyrhizobium sp.]|nr:methyl-accepting chemotaxis sensory transducer [Bradyrhizobium sp.]